MARVKTEERRDHIVACASGVFEEFGFQGATMEEVATRANLTKRAVYGYFSSKEELFAAVIVGSHVRTDERERSLSQLREGRSVEDALIRFGMEYLTYVLSEPELKRRRLLIEAARRGHAGLLVFDSGPKQSSDRIAGFIAQRMEANELRKSDPAVATAQLLALLRSEQFQRRLEGALLTPVKRSEVRRNVLSAVDTFLRAYAPEPAETRSKSPRLDGKAPVRAS
jgi:AcrR family transcriptional regulator